MTINESYSDKATPKQKRQILSDDDLEDTTQGTGTPKDNKGKDKVPPEEVEDLEVNETLKHTIIYLPTKRLEQLRTIAFQRGVTRASLVREAVEDWFERQQNPNPKEKIPNELLDKILDYCTKDYGDGFEIDGDTGFVVVMQENKLKLKDLTEKQWAKVAQKIQIGYSGYFSKPSPEEFADKFDPISPSKEQRTWLASNEAPPEDSEEEREKQ